MTYDTSLKRLKVSEIITGDRIRKTPGNILELAESMKTLGQLQPIIVRGNDLIAGFRRWAAVVYLETEEESVLGLEPGEILAMEYFELTPFDKLLVEFEENRQRKNFTQAEEALAVSKLKAEIEKITGKPIPNKELAERLNYSTSWISQALRVGEAITVGGKRELLAAPSVPGAYKDLLSTEKLDELIRRAEKSRPKARLSFEKKLHCGDALEWIKELSDGSVDLVHYDPPWGIGIDSYDRNHKYEDFDDDSNTGITLARSLIPECYRVLKNDTYMIAWFGIQYYQFLMDELTEAGFNVNPVPYIWYKSNKGGSQNDPSRHALNVWEPFFVVSKGEPRMFKRAQTNLLEYEMVRGIDRTHFAQKNVDLLVDILERFSYGEMVVLDSTFGSGSVFVAAQRLGRPFLGCEKDPENHKKAIEWLTRSGS